MHSFRFPPASLPPEAEALRGEVRAFLDETLEGMPPVERARSWSGFSPEFSRKLGQRGWIGMTWPKQYGGQERSAFERYVLLEELLAAGAPVMAHWVADRQSGPLLLRYGSEAQRRSILPKIAAGEGFFCIGMSEPDSGSDLASIRTRARKVDGGWLVNGRKIWTSGAHLCHYQIALVRTDGTAESRHAGLSQFLVDLSTPGIHIRPIRNMAGEEHFNEVLYEDVLLPDEALIGQAGQGWEQVTAELAFERSGPERYLSSFQLIVELLRALPERPGPDATAIIGRIATQLFTLRQMSLSVAAKLQAGESPALEASVVKDLGVNFEQSIPALARQVMEAEPSMLESGDFAETLAYVTMAAPSFSLRGGTTEILRGIIARGLGLR